MTRSRTAARTAAMQKSGVYTTARETASRKVRSVGSVRRQRGCVEGCEARGRPGVVRGAPQPRRHPTHPRLPLGGVVLDVPRLAEHLATARRVLGLDDRPEPRDAAARAVGEAHLRAEERPLAEQRVQCRHEPLLRQRPRRCVADHVASQAGHQAARRLRRGAVVVCRVEWRVGRRHGVAHGGELELCARPRRVEVGEEVSRVRAAAVRPPVSYTHLTLPTICSV
eukprot:3028038-Prymnesium_polylepis.2